ncbi:peptidase [Pseudarthrobacter phenanthrenivorans]|uniref:S1 family peptidase n=1 Tax=Pseudarthrobacter phenanthrenivorans TaxID=361575 RepID=UPI00112C1DFA|nr:S1 family peptidase [Pseudarthrobacter phenanthrenivorans]TPV52460.1 peptidase [Pseudarthrobacter phenanthrenivorans]
MRAGLARLLTAGAAAGLLASSGFAAGPVRAADGSELPAPSATATQPTSSPGLSEAALEEAVARDLGLTPEEFAAAGERGTQAAAAAGKLRDVPGYLGIRLQDGRIVVSGSGEELHAAVAALAADVPGLTVEAPPVTEETPQPVPEETPQPVPEETPQPAPDPGSKLALSTEQLFQAYLDEVGPRGLQAVLSAGGKFVIRTGADNAAEAGKDAGGTPSTTPGAAAPGKISPAEFVARFANVELDGGAPLGPEADVPGGVGYIADTGWVCSTGFSAFDPAGLPSVLTAGHCTSDGTAETAELEFQFDRTGLLGRFGFSQFGGPGNSPVVEDPLDPDNLGNVGTDVAVVESLRADLDPIPAASTWGDPSEPEPDVKIIGTADPVAGMEVCRSGRSSFWSCGTIAGVGIIVVPGPNYAQDSRDLRAFRGFASYDVQSSGGDSGGPWVSGNYAVGTHAAGETAGSANVAIGATLKDGLAVLPGYELELFLNKPAVSSPAPGGTYEGGQVISGNVPAAPASDIPANSAVRITIEGQDRFDVPVNADGSWSFTAPDSNETLRFTAETVNGYSASGTAAFEFASAVPARPAPPVTPPAGTNPAPSPAGTPYGGGSTAVVPSATNTPPADLADTGYDRRSRGTTGHLAYTGASPLPAAGAAAAAILVGALLMVLVRRRKQHSAR